jgi:hypothetical protein
MTPAAILQILAALNILPPSDGRKDLRAEAAWRFIYEHVRRLRLTD